MENNGKIVFLFGAGASAPAGVPTTHKFVEDFEKNNEEKCKLSQKEKECFQSIRQKLNRFKKEDPDIETVLETLRKLNNRKNDFLLAFYPSEKFLLEQYEQELEELEEKLRIYIRKRCIVDEGLIEYLEPLKMFIDDHGEPLHIFMVNYDTSVEAFCEKYQLKWSDGFHLNWDQSLLKQKSNNLINIYKLHGSVIWYRTKDNDYYKVPIKDVTSDVQLFTGIKADNLIIYPTEDKTISIKPLDDLRTLFREILSDKCKICIAIGYSFRDKHILGMFKEAIRINKDLVILLISRSANKIYKERFTENILQDKIIPIDGLIENILPDLWEKVDYLEYGLRDEKRAKELELKRDFDGMLSVLNATIRHYLNANAFLRIEKILRYKITSKNFYQWPDGSKYRLEAFFRAGEINLKERDYDFAQKCFREVQNILDGIEYTFDQQLPEEWQKICGKKDDPPFREDYSNSIQRLSQFVEMVWSFDITLTKKFALEEVLKELKNKIKTLGEIAKDFKGERTGEIVASEGYPISLSNTIDLLLTKFDNTNEKGSNHL